VIGESRWCDTSGDLGQGVASSGAVEAGTPVWRSRPWTDHRGAVRPRRSSCPSWLGTSTGRCGSIRRCRAHQRGAVLGRDTRVASSKYEYPREEACDHGTGRSRGGLMSKTPLGFDRGGRPLDSVISIGIIIDTTMMTIAQIRPPAPAVLRSPSRPRRSGSGADLTPAAA